MHLIQLSWVCLGCWNLRMDWMDTLEELETIELLDIWNEEFGGIDIDWMGFGEFFAGEKDGDPELVPLDHGPVPHI